jgi:hypothetical protein
MLNGKVYIVTSPELVTAVNRNSKTLALNPFIAQVGKRITGHDDATSEIVQVNLNGENGKGYVIDLHDRVLSALAPGQRLENMIAPMIREITGHLTKMEDIEEIDLFSWTKKMITMCSTAAIYGLSNPFSKNPEYCDLFWSVPVFCCELS